MEKFKYDRLISDAKIDSTDGEIKSALASGQEIPIHNNTNENPVDVPEESTSVLSTDGTEGKFSRNLLIHCPISIVSSPSFCIIFSFSNEV